MDRIRRILGNVRRRQTGEGSSVAIGAAVGAGLGVAMDNLAIGIAIGVALGAAGVFATRR